MMETVRAEEPKMLYFAGHLNEDGSEASTVRVHADAENMAFHIEWVEDRIRAAGQYLDVDSLRTFELGVFDVRGFRVRSWGRPEGRRSGVDDR